MQFNVFCILIIDGAHVSMEYNYQKIFSMVKLFVFSILLIFTQFNTNVIEANTFQCVDKYEHICKLLQALPEETRDPIIYFCDCIFNFT